MMAPPLGWDLMWHWPSAKGKSLTGLIWVDGTEASYGHRRVPVVSQNTMETSKKIHWLFVRLGHIKITLYQTEVYSCYIIILKPFLLQYICSSIFENKHNPTSTIHVADRWGAFKTGLVIGSEGLTRLATSTWWRGDRVNNPNRDIKSGWWRKSLHPTSAFNDEMENTPPPPHTHTHLRRISRTSSISNIKRYTWALVDL